jgi:hypothetical protein
MDLRVEIRYVIKCYVRLGKTGTEISENYEKMHSD